MYSKLDMLISVCDLLWYYAFQIKLYLNIININITLQISLKIPNNLLKNNVTQCLNT